MLCVILTSCQKSVQVNPHATTAPVHDSELISNESDYLYVFNRYEEQLKSAPNRIRNDRLINYIEAVLCRLSINYCERLRVYVLENPEFNAHMLPNGAFIILTGLLLRVDNESQLAYVLAHELGHYVGKDGIKKINYSRLKNNNKSNKTTSVLRQSSNDVSLNKYTQKLEYDADLFAIDLLNKKQYDLNSVAKLFTDLAIENRAANKENIGGFNSSHPGTVRRISLFQKNSVDRSTHNLIDNPSWVKIKAFYIKKWLQLELSKREFKSSRVLLERLQKESPEPEYFDYFFAEIHRKQMGSDHQQKAKNYYLAHLQGKLVIDDAYKHLAQVYSALNKKQLAKNFYSKYLSSHPRPYDYNLIENRLLRFQ